MINFKLYSIQTKENCRSGFFPNQREDRRYGDTQKTSQNFLSFPKNTVGRVSGILHIRPDGNTEYVYPFNHRPITNNYDPYGRPLPPYQDLPNNYPQYPYENPYARPVQFPNSRPYEEQYNYQNQDDYQYPPGGNCL